MSAETVFISIKDILIKPVQTIRHLNPDIGTFSVQAVVVRFEDGSTHNLMFHHQPGGNTMVSAEIIPLVIPSKLDTWVYIDMLISAGPENKKARIYAGFGAFSAFVY
jgi:hypothetical protein